MNYLITGSTGMLGQALVAEAQKRGNVFKTLARSGSDYNIDLSNPVEIARVIEDARPDVIINTAAITSLDRCEADPGHAYLVNARPAGILAALAQEYSAYFVQISTDHYFSGDRAAKHDEKSTIRLVNEYARTKYAGERLALLNPDALIVRTNIVGFRKRPGQPTFVEWVLSQLERRHPFVAFDDFFTSSIDVRQFSRILFDLLQLRPSGILNVASSEVSSKRQFIEALAKTGGFALSTMAVGSIVTIPGPPRANSLGLDTNAAQMILNRKLPDLASVVASLVEEYEGRYAL